MVPARNRFAFYAINCITLYRIVTAPLLIVLIITGEIHWFKWLLGISFFTDLIDGELARVWKVSSVVGTRLDSIGDDLTVLVAIFGLWYRNPAFIQNEWPLLVPLATLFLIQTGSALYRYGRITSFHTFLAKAAALSQGVFLLSYFFFESILYPLFYIATTMTMIELAEEIILVFWLPQWESNVKGIWWVWKRKS
jgi:phosphatidylglycerophosphate synthase